MNLHQISSGILSHRPPRIAMLLLALAATLHWLTPLGAIPVLPSAYLPVAIGLTGFVVMMWAWWQFKRNNVAICPTDRTTRLLTTGVYRLTRNPMYLGMVMMLAAVAIWIGTLPFVAAAIAYFVIINFVFCPFEEDKLTTAFGDDYSRYRNRVGRWI